MTVDTKLIFLALFILFVNNNLFAQEKPGYLPEDVDPKSLTMHRYAKPGVLNESRSRGLEFSLMRKTGGDFFGVSGNQTKQAENADIRRHSFKIRLPLLLKNNFRLLAGYSFSGEQFQLNNISGTHAPVFQHLDQHRLKSQSASLIADRSFNERQYFVARVKVSYNGDYEPFITTDGEYRVLSVTGLFGNKKSQNTEWGIGVNYSNSFRSTIFLPFFMYNHNFNESFGIETVLPSTVLGRFNFGDATLLLFGAEYSSKSYKIDVNEVDTKEAYFMNHSEIRFPLRLEQRIHSWFWIGAQVGYQFNFNMDFDARPDRAFEINPDPFMFYRIGLFLSPPDDF